MINMEMNLIDDLKKAEMKSMRDGYGEAMVIEGGRIPNMVVLVADLLESLRVSDFKKEFSERVFEMGIAEQNMMGVAAGMSMSGKIPVVNSFACFSPGRNWEQMKVSVCLTKNNVKIVGGHSGFGNGEDGANQQMFEDLALTRVLPNMVVLVPVDYEQVKKAVRAMINHVGPVYLRMTKPARAVLTTRSTPFELGKVQVFREGSEVTVFASGVGVYEAMMAAEKLAGEIEVEVVNVHTIKPVDVEGVVKSAKKTGKVITVEEHSVNGGLGGVIAEVLGENYPVKIKRIGINDVFGESGEPSLLLKKYGISEENIVSEIRKMCRG